MEKSDGYKWAKKAYIILSLVVVAVIWACFFASLLWGRLSRGPVEETWLLEVLKWVFMTPFIVLGVDVIAYAWIGTTASRINDGIDESQKKKDKE